MLQQEFEEKFEQAVNDSALTLFRSFVTTYYADLNHLNDLGPLGICFGDLHPENFGFLEYQDGIQFLYNDFDDTGYCPIALDALRYFVALRLSKDQKDKIRVDDLILEYVKALTEHLPLLALSTHQIQDPQKHLEKELKKYTEGHHFLARKDLEKISDSEKKRIQQTVQSHFPSIQVFDVVSYTKESGGSGGLKRYWLLTKHAGKKDILELKPFIEPATNQGNWGEEPSPRLEWAMHEIWQEHVPLFYSTVLFENTSYLFRSRSFKNLKIEKESESQKLFWYRHEIRQIASHHAPYWSAKDLEGLSTWLSTGSKVIAHRFEAVVEAFKKQPKKPN